MADLNPEIAGAEALHGSVAELSPATLPSFAAGHSTLAIVYAVPLVVSLRHAQLVAETRVDGKTGLLNDRTWRREAAGEIARAARTRSPADTGHPQYRPLQVSQRHLRAPGRRRRPGGSGRCHHGALREYDIVGRVGGEEFAFILPGTPPAEAVGIAERLRERIPRIPFTATARNRHAAPHRLPRAGNRRPGQHDWDLGGYHSLADKALYEAKHHGRDALWAVTGDHAGDLGPRPVTSLDSQAGPPEPPGRNAEARRIATASAAPPSGGISEGPQPVVAADTQIRNEHEYSADVSIDLNGLAQRTITGNAPEAGNWGLAARPAGRRRIPDQGRPLPWKEPFTMRIRGKPALPGLALAIAVPLIPGLSCLTAGQPTAPARPDGMAGRATR